jgi:hypothetical protein
MKIGIIGGGWRSEFYMRIAKELDQFQILCVYRTTSEKAMETERKFGIPSTDDYEQFFSYNFDYVVVSLPRTVVLPTLLDLITRRIPIIVETPPGASIEEYNALWNASQKTNVPILVAEQYFCQPYHQANLNLIKQGKLGKVTTVSNSMMHGYHGICMIRKYLQIGVGSCEIIGKYEDYPITKTCGRSGMIFTGEVKHVRRELFRLIFNNSIIALWDFSGEQYFSYIRQRHLFIHGTRGEICDYTCRFLTESNHPVELSYHRYDTGLYSNMETFTHHGIALGEEMMFQNPFDGFRLNDDEIAIATLMQNMNNHLEYSTPLVYPLRDALHDSYLSLLLDEAAAKGATNTTPQSWF